MKHFHRIAVFTFLCAILFTLGTGASPAPRRHPAYLHALSDLRWARALLEHPGGGELREQERDAVEEIDHAIDEIKRASIDDGKNPSEHPPIDEHLAWGGHLRKSLELLDKARRDVAREEDDPAAQGLRARALEHIDKAHRHVREAMAIAR